MSETEPTLDDYRLALARAQVALDLLAWISPAYSGADPETVCAAVNAIFKRTDDFERDPLYLEAVVAEESHLRGLAGPKLYGVYG